MRAKKVLLTGSAGFIGSHLVEQLIASGADVTALVHYNAARDIGNLSLLEKSVLDSVKIEFGDICDPEFISALVKEKDLVFHLAALIAIPYSYVAPRSYVRANVEGTLNVLEACRRWEVERLIHTSTSEVYGTAHYVPIDEKHPLQGQSPYSGSKIGADKMVESYRMSFDLPVVTVRPFNTYGPRQSARAFIPTVIGQALRGGDIKLGSTTPIRDLTFVADTCAGFLAAAESEATVGGTFNLGVGEGWSIGDVAQRIIEMMGAECRIVTDPERMRPEKSEVQRLVSDNTLFRKQTGWEPLVSLDDGLARTIEFFRQGHRRLEADSYVV